MAAAIIGGVGITCSAPLAARQVDIELVLAVDVSGSVDAGEQELQRMGLVAAFRDPAVIEAIKALPGGRGASGHTAIGDALIWSLRELAGNRFDGQARIDISGDGHSNCGEYPQLVRDRAVAAGVAINGLAIVNEEPYLAEFYRRSVIGGAGAGRGASGNTVITNGIKP
jgi:hypothetical protein